MVKKFTKISKQIKYVSNFFDHLLQNWLEILSKAEKILC